MGFSEDGVDVRGVGIDEGIGDGPPDSMVVVGCRIVSAARVLEIEYIEIEEWREEAM